MNAKSKLNIPETDGIGHGLDTCAERGNGGEGIDLCIQAVFCKEFVQIRLSCQQTFVQNCTTLSDTGISSDVGWHLFLDEDTETVKGIRLGHDVKKGGCKKAHALGINAGFVTT